MSLSGSICDATVCPRCAALERVIAGAPLGADEYITFAGELWAVCAVHQVRWFVTRALLGFGRPARTLDLQCAIVVPVLR